MYMYIYMYMYVYICKYIYIYIHMYIAWRAAARRIMHSTAQENRGKQHPSHRPHMGVTIG